MIPRTDRGRRVQQRIYADRPQCVAVVGDPRIGKTTFLDWLVRAAEEADPPPPSGTRFVRLSLAGPASASPSAFLHDVLEALRTASPAADEEPSMRASTLPGSTDASPRTYAAFETEVQEAAQADGRVILLLDDFDHVTRSQAFPATFFSFLRAQANQFPVAYVTTSRQDLQQLCVLKEVEESPFFNIFQNFNLGPLDEAAAAALVAERAPSADPAVLGAWTWEESGGLPEIAVACADLVAAGAEPGDAAREPLDAQLAPYFTVLWEHFDTVQRALLERIAAGEPPGERDARPLRDLGPRRGYVREREGRWGVSSAALRRFLASRPGASAPGLMTRVKRLFGGSK